MKKLILMCIFGILIFSTSLYAQRTSDIENSKDYPLISRFEGSFIEFYKETKWGAYKLPVNDKGKIDWDKPQTLEGKVIRIQYTTSIDNNSEYVLQNYKAAFKKAGFTILIAIANEELGVGGRPHTWHAMYYTTDGYYKCLNNAKFGFGINLPAWKDNHAFIAAKVNKDGKDIYVIDYTVVCDNYTLITQDVIEVEAVETGMVSAENIAKGIQTDGHIAVYDILFETGKSDIKPESDAVIKSVADYMNSNPTKKFYIVGHTDNVGDFAANMMLSENRAKAVLNELITKYAVKSEQLKAYGASSLVPVANNSTEEGKTKNRRVDIVEQ
jgi:outer membrane protein OmpA-like peptidoglycan-associated protein